MRLKKCTLSLGLLLCFPTFAACGRDSAAAQQPALDPAHQQAPVRPDQNIRVQSLLVTTPVTVIGRSGELVYNLKKNDFQLLDNGVPQTILRFDVAPQPVAAVIVIEANDTVEPLINQVHPLGPVFSSLLLGPRGEAAVITYSDVVQVIQDLSASSDRLATTLKSVKSEGSGARLNDALARALSLLEPEPKTWRRIIIVFSDGADRGSETQKADVVRRATNDEVTVYGLGFSRVEALLKQKPEDTPTGPLDANVTRPVAPGVAPTPTNSARIYSTPVPAVPIMTAAGEMIRSEVSKNLVETYAGYTGGVYYSHWSHNALQNQLNKIATEVQNQYQIAYVPSTLSQTGFHRIEVVVQRPGMMARARAGYFYAPQPR